MGIPFFSRRRIAQQCLAIELDPQPRAFVELPSRRPYNIVSVVVRNGEQHLARPTDSTNWRLELSTRAYFPYSPTRFEGQMLLAPRVLVAAAD